MVWDIPYSKNTSHVLQLSVFRRRINKRCDPIVLELETTLSLTLISNPFDQVLDCETSPEEKINRPHDCGQFSKSKPHNSSRNTSAFVSTEKC